MHQQVEATTNILKFHVTAVEMIRTGVAIHSKSLKNIRSLSYYTKSSCWSYSIPLRPIDFDSSRFQSNLWLFMFLLLFSLYDSVVFFNFYLFSFAIYNFSSSDFLPHTHAHASHTAIECR